MQDWDAEIECSIWTPDLQGIVILKVATFVFAAN